MIGRQLGGYEILSELGHGGMGVVYRARQAGLGRIVALKVLHEKLAQNREFVLRFLREARSIAALEHPGIVTVYDVGDSEGTYYFAMQLLEGETLSDRIRRKGALPPDEAASLTAQVADALGFAHAVGIVHRDVKPENIVVLPEGRAILTDFGIAWDSSDTRLTQAGKSVGSPAYMSPEQISGRTADHRSDLYSLGVVFFQALAGRPPFEGDSAVSIAYQHVRDVAPSVAEIQEGVPSRAARVVSRLLEKEPGARYPSAAELLPELWRLAGRHAPAESSHLHLARPDADDSRRRRILILAIATVATALLLVVGLWFGTRPAGTAALVPPTEPSTEFLRGQGSPSAESPPMPTAESALESRRILLQTAPPGARIRLDGRELETPTPTEIELTDGRRTRLELSAEGHHPIDREVGLDDLNDIELESATLTFDLTPVQAPGQLIVRARYPVDVRLDGRTQRVPADGLELPPGRHRVTFSSPRVFFSDTRTLSIRSGERLQVELPPSTSITVAANPSRCRLRIDGRTAGDLPTEVEVTVGEHLFEFTWDALEKQTSLRRHITARTERVFATAP